MQQLMARCDQAREASEQVRAEAQGYLTYDVLRADCYHLGLELELKTELEKLGTSLGEHKEIKRLEALVTNLQAQLQESRDECARAKNALRLEKIFNSHNIEQLKVSRQRPGYRTRLY